MKGLCSAVFRQPCYLMSISFMIFIIFTIYYYLQCSVCLLSSHPFTFCRLGAWQDPVCLSCICPLPFSSPLYPHLPLSSTASGMQAFEQGRRASLLEGRVLALCFFHQMSLTGYSRDASRSITLMIPQGPLG